MGKGPNSVTRIRRDEKGIVLEFGEITLGEIWGKDLNDITHVSAEHFYCEGRHKVLTVILSPGKQHDQKVYKIVHDNFGGKGPHLRLTLTRLPDNFLSIRERITCRKVIIHSGCGGVSVIQIDLKFIIREEMNKKYERIKPTARLELKRMLDAQRGIKI